MSNVGRNINASKVKTNPTISSITKKKKSLTRAATINFKTPTTLNRHGKRSVEKSEVKHRRVKSKEKPSLNIKPIMKNSEMQTEMRIEEDLSSARSIEEEIKRIFNESGMQTLPVLDTRGT